jgi:hypothetical protein
MRNYIKKSYLLGLLGLLCAPGLAPAQYYPPAQYPPPAAQATAGPYYGQYYQQPTQAAPPASSYYPAAQPARSYPVTTYPPVQATPAQPSVLAGTRVSGTPVELWGTQMPSGTAGPATPAMPHGLTAGTPVIVESGPADMAWPACCDHGPCCKKCVTIPTTIKRVKVLYGEKCVDYCLPRCHCCERAHHDGGCDHCDGHGDYGLCRCLTNCVSCGKPRTKHILLKREETVECNSFKCVVPGSEAEASELPRPSVIGSPTIRPGTPPPTGQSFRLPEGPPTQ